MSDPFDGLEDWAKQAERRAKRADRRRRWRALFRIRSQRARTVAWFGSAVIAAVLLSAALPTIRTYLPGGSAYSDPDSSDPASYPAVVADPFDGTPAASYAKGEAGITMPPASAVTGFTAVEVDAALRQVRSALVAGRLDQKMLVGHDPSAFLALLAPNSAKGIRPWFDGAAFSAVATWIDPDVRLDPSEEVRVSGQVTFDSAEVEGVQTLRVTTNFVWIYAFTGNARHPLAAEHDEIRWDFPATARLRAEDKGMWVGKAGGYLAWIDCAAAGKGLLAPYRTGADLHPGATEDPDAYLKADHALTVADDCDLPPAPSSSSSSSQGG
jgi:hypothetical protein